MSYSIYGDWTLEEAKDIGREFEAICKSSYGYENCLKIGNKYTIKITPRILTMSPLCEGIGEGDKPFECHLERFSKPK